jgi:uracil-DNA glycosylase
MNEQTFVGELDDRPRSMKDTGVRERRRAMLNLPHIAPLKAYTARLCARDSVQVPDFDPLDGGIDAQVLFLLEKPGPMTAEGDNAQRAGSGFISRDNDDPTAAATFRFMQEAGIQRKLTVIWNVIPWWNGTRKVTPKELRAGADELPELINLLPGLRAVVLVGAKAARAKRYLKSTGLELFSSSHPSPIVKATLPDRWNAIPSEWRTVREFLDLGKHE